MTTDGNKIASYMKDAVLNLKSESRKAVYVIIATAWTISFTNGKFTPTAEILWALGLALSYLFLDLLYYLISSSLYKCLLFIYFESEKDGDFQYKNEYKKGGSITKITKCWNHVGQIWLFFMTTLLLASFAAMVCGVISLGTN